jgi:hypothetical protein
MALDALELTHPLDERARCELLLAVGEAEVRAGDVVSAKRAFLDAAGIARRLGMPRELARAAAAYGGRFMWARAAGDDKLLPLLEEGLAARSARTMSSSGSGSSPASPGCFATSVRVSDATA